MGKGDSPRPVDATKYRENWDRIFAKVQDAQQHYRAKVQDAQQHYRDALDELAQLSQEMGMYPAIDEHGHQDLA
ncbi:MAG: hypothetical protein E6R03_08845 [Hyphomicrobiaceae bacterium]|nr:MAG: hypothetical protein E6R03_08845 [Hyphomicrobiaceae bacterium]